MFTGITTAIGTVTAIEDRGDRRLTIGCPWEPDRIALGASIACSGVCLTVVDRGEGGEGPWFAVDVSEETVSRTARGQWEVGRRLNLERALRVGDELGGHIVTGHVDGVGTIAARAAAGGSIRIVVEAPAPIAALIAPKGSITVDGVSLTVNEVDDRADGACRFALNLIPHTAEITTLGALREGDAVNLEIDVLARYLERMVALRR